MLATGPPMALYIVVSVSLSLPHVLPAIDFMTLFLDCILSLTFLVWVLNVKSGSNVTPRIFGFLIVGTGVLSISISSCIFTSFLHSVKSVADDFPGDSSRCCSFSQLFTSSR